MQIGAVAKRILRHNDDRIGIIIEEGRDDSRGGQRRGRDPGDGGRGRVRSRLCAKGKEDRRMRTRVARTINKETATKSKQRKEAKTLNHQDEQEETK